ncbi:DUF2971 domain-containing protein [Desulfovibrio sp. OttesenSCG-928-G15]|nr:DUF2971 domain-containing protein [Desulfovibrio sp. OttesenSCG-928-G15]
MIREACTRIFCCIESPDPCPGKRASGIDCKKLCEYGHIKHIQKTLGHLPLFERMLPEVFADAPDHLLYQYRNFSGFWSILESNSLWASNARFSNDYAEQMQGFETLCRCQKKQCIENAETTKAQTLEIEDCYILCFCRNGDTLSQWRGYASDGGVAIGFDFSNIRPFTILKKETDSLPKAKASKKANTKNHHYYNACCSVTYVDPKNEDELTKMLGSSPLVSLSTYIKKAQTLMPFIKHHSFHEEQEYRLVFANIGDKLHDAIQYRDWDGIRIPYIVVKAGQDEHAATTSVVRIVEDDAEIAKTAVEYLNKKLTKIGSKAIACQHFIPGSNVTMEDCRGCILRHCKYQNEPDGFTQCSYPVESKDSRGFVVHSMSRGIYISQGSNQKKAYDIVLQARNKGQFPDLKIWCDGYLPIRKIIVGPSSRQDEHMEAVRHYCNNRFWLRDVAIDKSMTPYRKNFL